jgi:methylated-DNA-[protein]-cysteine S-methyltransferase
MEMKTYTFTCATTFGHVAIAVSNAGLVALSWPAGSPEAALASLGSAGQRTAPGSEWAGLIERLQAYYAGECVSFAAEPIDWDGVPPFRRQAWAAVQRIPWGNTRTYGQVALEIGAPGAARAVGGAMAANRLPIVVPCHRVVGSGGRLVGFGAGLPMKARLLAMEGVSWSSS